MNCGPMTEPACELTEDAFLGGRLRLRQPKSGHRAGHDAILLAAATAARAGNRVVDFGAGVGAAGLALAARVPAIQLVLVEIDEVLAELARGNAVLNRIEANIIAMDLASGAEAFAGARLGGAADHRAREIAHVADAATLEVWIHAARRILKSGGVLTLIWRADGLGQVLAALDRGFGSLAILPVHGNAATTAIRVLVRAVKGGRAPTALYPGLLLNDESGLPNKQVQDIVAGRGALPLAML